MAPACEQSYGFLPCANDLYGSLFLMAVYGYILLIGAGYIADGSEMLLHILDPGIIGGLVLPILGALPDAIMIVVAGLGCSPEEAAEQVEVGVGTLVGSTVMLLSLAWGGSVWLGRCDLRAGGNGTSIDRRLTKPCDFFHTGVTAEDSTRPGSWIMSATTALYLVVQVPAMLGHADSPGAALVGCMMCIVALAAYCAYQVVSPELQRRRIVKARKRFMRYRLIARMHGSLGGIMDNSGSVSRRKCDEIFALFDRDGNGEIDVDELEALLIGLSVGSDSAAVSAVVRQVMSDFDNDNNNALDRDEFFHGICKWVEEKRVNVRRRSWLGYESGEDDRAAPDVEQPLLAGPGGGAGDDEEHSLEEVEEDMEEEAEEIASWPKWKICLYAVAKMAFGTALCGVFADPMVAAVGGFSVATGIPRFFISFVVTPLASNASELVSSLQFATKKRTKNISLTFSQVYGAVTMNNTMCLGLFLFVVYYQRLPWTYTVEVITVVWTTAVLGWITHKDVTFRAVWAPVMLAVYPLAVALCFFMQNVLGWT
ncbi:unnamed protein product [Pedinophyceae sp. YPF-701]|nr:unnamed protein product [Pedinophyceae sp. YPF-701]